MLKAARLILTSIAVLFCGLLIFQRLFCHTPVTQEILFYGNPSMFGTYIALALLGSSCEPLAWLSAVLLGRSTPFLILGIYRFCKNFSWGLLVIVSLVGFAYIHKYGLPSGTGRYEVWEWYLKWWWKLPEEYMWTGIGWGKTAFYLPQVQILNLAQNHRDVFSHAYLLQAHNDFLQLLVETGVLGFEAFLVITTLLFRWATPEQRYRGAAYLVAMGTNFPWQAYPHKLLYGLWAVEILAKFLPPVLKAVRSRLR